jgi:S-DNA-T family DNA segregation ATPase FtsK/SpoIIIE
MGGCVPHSRWRRLPRVSAIAGDARSVVRVTLRLADGSERDVEVEGAASATAGEIAGALAFHAGAPARSGLHCLRLGPLPDELPLQRSGLRDGDVVALDPLGRAAADTLSGSGAPVAELVVVGGPAAGRRVSLTVGAHTIGRDAGADVTIDDPSMSGHHLELRIAAQGLAAIVDVGSSNGTAVDGVGLPVGEPHPLGPEEQVEAGRSLLAIRPWRSSDPTVLGARRDVMAFNRPPRVARPYTPPTLRVDAPPPPMRRVRLPLLAALVPLVMGLSLFLITSSPYLLLMAGLSPMMLLSTFIGDRSSGRKEHAEARAGFEEAVARLEQQLEHRRREEIVERRAVAPDAGELAVRARRLLSELWERRPGDGDFLDVRLGVADQPSIVSVAFGSGGDPELRAIVEELVTRYRDVPAVPVRARLADVGAIGLAGHESYTESLARWIVVQLATLHSPRDVVIAAALSPARARTWGWLGWLPHTTHAGSPLSGAHVVAGETAAYELVKGIATLARERREEDAGRAGARRRRRVAVVLLVDEDVAPDRTTVDELLDGCADVDVSAIWLARERRDLPGGCGAIVELAGDRAVADITWAASGQRIAAASADGMSLQTAESVARALAPVRDVSAGGSAADLPRTVSLTALLELPEPTGQQVAARWREAGSTGLRGVIGVTTDGPYAIDLRADGPHALVGGTTGSGKSELLQTLIASLAVSVPPDRLAFLLVDYKGGAAFKDCRHLPHSAGMVTDLDEHEVHRALVSLEAELKRREEVLRVAGAKDLLELERRATATAPPSLVIVVDEFATLAREVPAFVEGIVDVAQRGRSLGVHVVLATQRPSGAVTDNIRANTELRIALRVAGVAESEDVINAPDAARLPRSVPGRALARTGPSELTLFQAAYVGGRTARARPDRGVVVRDLRFGVPVVERAARAAEGGEEEVTDLVLLVEAAREAAQRERLRLPAAPWLPALPDIVTPDEAGELAGGAAAGNASVAFGVVDEPRRQRRTAAVVDLARDGNLLVYGGTGAGKTTVLRTLAAGLAAQASPDELWLYGLDFAGRGLAGVEALAHCGSIVPGDDEERVVRLLATLRRAIDERGRRFAARGVLTLDEYRRAAPDDPRARIVVLVDSYAGFTDAYEKVDLGAYVDALPRLVADGRAAGVHFVITGDRRMAIPQSITGVVARRVILRLADEHELSSLGLDAREVRGARLPPGRGFLDDGREVQVAVLGAGGSGERQNAALARLGEALAARHGGAGAPPIERMPTALARGELPRRSAPLRPVLGVDDIDLSAVVLPLEEGHAAIIGSYRSGRSTALGTIARSLGAAPAAGELHLLAPRRSALTELDVWTSVARGLDACETRVPELVEEVYARSGEGPEAPLIVVIDDAGELAEAVCAGAIEMLLRRGRDRGVHVVAALERGQARHYAPWIRELRKDGTGLLLDPDLDLDGELLSVRLPRRSNAFFPPGRGYLVVNGTARLIQVAG